MAAGLFERSQYRRRRGILRRLAEACVALVFLAGLLLVLDFSRFVALVAKSEPSTVERADGIVALTGGAERIDDALNLLAAGRGDRLLITGVNLATSARSLGAASPRNTALFECCIDIDRNALNTVGNAIEAARWIRDHSYERVIIVTSSYHMPRALMEMQRELPGIAFTPYPVVSERLELGEWWHNTGTVRVLVSEYAKYAAARVAIRFDAPTIYNSANEIQQGRM